MQTCFDFTTEKTKAICRLKDRRNRLKLKIIDHRPKDILSTSTSRQLQQYKDGEKKILLDSIQTNFKQHFSSIKADPKDWAAPTAVSYDWVIYQKILKNGAQAKSI